MMSTAIRALAGVRLKLVGLAILGHSSCISAREVSFSSPSWSGSETEYSQRSHSGTNNDSATNHDSGANNNSGTKNASDASKFGVNNLSGSDFHLSDFNLSDFFHRERSEHHRRKESDRDDIDNNGMINDNDTIVEENAEFGPEKSSGHSNWDNAESGNWDHCKSWPEFKQKFAHSLDKNLTWSQKESCNRWSRQLFGKDVFGPEGDKNLLCTLGLIFGGIFLILGLSIMCNVFCCILSLFGLLGSSVTSMMRCFCCLPCLPLSFCCGPCLMFGGNNGNQNSILNNNSDNLEDIIEGNHRVDVRIDGGSRDDDGCGPCCWLFCCCCGGGRRRRYEDDNDCCDGGPVGGLLQLFCKTLYI
jgi:hypothetical protein